MEPYAFSAPELARLCRILAEPDAELALGWFVEQLSQYGIRADDELREGARVVEVGDVRLVVSSARGLSAETWSCVCDLSAALLQRLVEGRAHRQVVERMQLLSEASFEGIMVNVGGVVIDANLRLAEQLGMEPHEVLGERTMRECVAPEDLPSVMQRVASGYEGAYVITGVRKDGSRFRAELQSKQGTLGKRPVRVVAVRDVTERERTLELLRESEARLRDLAEAAFDVTVLSREGVVVDISGKYEQLFGYQKHDVVGRPILDFVAPSAVPHTERAITEAHTGVYQTTLMNPAGEPVAVEVVGVTSTLDGIPTRIAGLRDLRASQRIDAERRELERQVERTQRLDSLGVLAGGVAHDFNNLLVGILGNADLLLSEAPDGSTQELLAAIVSAAQQAAGLTAGLLAYAGRGEPMERRVVDVGLVLTELRAVLAGNLRKQVSLVIDAAPQATVMADKAALTHVLMNLLTNAADALNGEAGTITARVRREPQPDARWDGAFGATITPGDWVMVEVEDTGVGMDEATKARAFEPFFSTKSTGHGLGLAACLGIVSSHAGAVVVDSAPGKGSRFSILLPATTSAARTPTAERVLTITAPCRVLVIDDELVVRAQLRRSLALRGYSVTEADGGRAGLSAFERDGADLVIVDMTMPDMDGAHVITRIREQDREVPIVLASGYSVVGAERGLDPASFQAFLRKPFTIGELVSAIEQARAARDPAR